VLDKYQVALTCADQQPMNLGEAPGQVVSAIILFRNDMCTSNRKCNGAMNCIDLNSVCDHT
jgi:hypothetical protein